jgi:hypothetical protein
MSKSCRKLTPDSATVEQITAPGGQTSLNDFLTDAHSSGWIEGMTINDNGGETITVDAGKCFIRTTASATASLVYRNTAALTSTAIPTNTTRYVLLTYAAGTMTPSISATDTSNTYNIIYVGEVHNVGGTLQIHNDHRPAGDAINRFQTAWSDIVGIRVKSGEVASESAALKLAVSAGAFNDHFGIPLTTAAFDSNVAGTFIKVRRDGAGDFVRLTGQTTIGVTTIDSPAGTETTITGGNYANCWVIRGINGDVALQLGQAQYATQALAEAESQPATRPEEYDEHGFYVAQLTFLKSAASLASITSIKPVVGGQFGAAAAATPTAHNDLIGLQGGSAAQYYHLTSAEYTGSGTGAFARTTSPVFTTPNIGSATGSITGNAATSTTAPTTAILVSQASPQTIGATGARLTKLWATDIESTNMPTVGGVAVLTSLTAPQFTTIELGHATDTTLTRVSAGVIAVEGNTLATKTGSGAATESFIIAVSDETTAITTGTAKTTFRMPYAFTLTAVRASLTTASTSGLPAIDINEAGVSVLSTTITIDANELTSTTAVTPPVISDTALADDAQITIDIDTAGTGAKGLKVYLIGYKT